MNILELKQPHPMSKIVVDEFNNLNEDSKNDQDRNNTVFFQSTSLCKSYRDHLSTNNFTSDSCNKSIITGTVNISILFVNYV